MPGVDAQPEKLGGYRFYREVLGSPKYVVAPMVDQSELAWRALARRYGAQLAYTPMINAKIFAESAVKPYREQAFNRALDEEGGPGDRPLIVQFCANDPERLLASAKVLERHCDAIDINLGCPQDIAKKGKYGAFLQDDWQLIYNLINILHTNLTIPVTAKFRVFPTVEKTVAYAQMLERAGAQILTCHGRVREQRGHNTGLADWDKIRAVKEAVSVPIFANGNILFHSDIDACLAATGADAVMSAEGQLYNAALFARHDHPHVPPTVDLSIYPWLARPPPETSQLSSPASSSTTVHPHSGAWDTGLHPPHADLALEYLDVVRSLATPTVFSAVKGHLFKILRPALAIAPDLREELGRIRKSESTLDEYEAVVREMKARMDAAACVALNRPMSELITTEPTTGLKRLPYWLSQPYFRPAPAPCNTVTCAPDPLRVVKAKLADRRATEATVAGTENGTGTSGVDETGTRSYGGQVALADVAVDLGDLFPPASLPLDPSAFGARPSDAPVFLDR